MSNTCSSCAFCSTLPEQHQSATICRFDSPKPFLVPVQTEHGNGLQATTIWPQVNPDLDFCSHHVGVASGALDS